MYVSTQFLQLKAFDFDKSSLTQGETISGGQQYIMGEKLVYLLVFHRYSEWSVTFSIHGSIKVLFFNSLQVDPM